MPQSLHYFKPGQDVTCTPTAPVIGARFVSITPGGMYNRPNVAHSAAGDRAFGVVARDADTDDSVLVHTGGIVPVTAGAAITASAFVAAGANGVAVVAASRADALGIAVADAASGEFVPVHLY